MTIIIPLLLRSAIAFPPMTQADFFTITLGDIAIALSAVITVIGSYWLYTRRKNDAADRLRHALFGEIGKMGDQIYDETIQMRSNELTEDPYRPEESPIITNVYDNNARELGRLTNNEIDSIISFYTKAKLVDDRLQRAINESEESAIKLIYIRSALVDLNNLRYDALASIENELERLPVEIEHRTRLEGGGDQSLSEIKDRLYQDDD